MVYSPSTYVLCGHRNLLAGLSDASAAGRVVDADTDTDNNGGGGDESDDYIRRLDKLQQKLDRGR